MSTFTTNFNLEKPDVGSDDDNWGGMLNAALDIIDAKLKALEIPIGGLYLSTVATNPNTALGYGTWVEHASGRALVGVGDNGESTWAVNDARGAEEHTLLEAELPTHDHSAGALVANSGGAHTHASGTLAANSTTVSGSFQMRRTNDDVAIAEGATGSFSTSQSGNTRGRLERASSIQYVNDVVTFSAAHTHTVSGATASNGAHTHTVSGGTATTGSDTPHNNIQPSIAVYVWRRTA
jgi:microcystin-dependent protein